MLRIWGRTTSSNVQKVLWAAEELGLAYERIDAGGAFGVVGTEAYGRLNPNRLIPTIEDDGVVVWESNAIVRHLAAKHGHGTLWPADPATRAVADMWMDWQLTTGGPDVTTCFLQLVRTPPERRDAAVVTTATERANAALARLDAHLAGRRFVAGDAFTMGDIPMGPIVWRWANLPIERPDLPSLSRWLDDLRTRPGFARHVAVPLT